MTPGPMKLLLIGGGAFLGRAVLDAALQRGHAVSVFNRGRRRTHWPVAVEVLVGDRQQDLGRLAGRRWDAVIDTCGYLPADVAASARVLADCPCYLFVSSISAYAALDRPDLDEDAPLAAFEQLAADDRSPAHYGAQKAGCEAALREVMGCAALVVRPGLIVGPGDPTGRFSHWAWRSAEGGRMVVPAAPADQPLQCIDVRDLAGWMVALVEQRASGACNATGPVLGWPDLLQACAEAAIALGRVPARAEPMPEADLLAQGVLPWRTLPLWIPSGEAGSRGFMAVSTARAAAAGLRTRALRDTAVDILREDPALPDDPRRADRLSAAQEQGLLALPQDTVL